MKRTYQKSCNPNRFPEKSPSGCHSFSKRLFLERGDVNCNKTTIFIVCFGPFSGEISPIFAKSTEVPIFAIISKTCFFAEDGCRKPLIFNFSVFIRCLQGVKGILNVSEKKN